MEAMGWGYAEGPSPSRTMRCDTIRPDPRSHNRSDFQLRTIAGEFVLDGLDQGFAEGGRGLEAG